MKVIKNAKVYTMTGDAKVYESLAWEGNKITAISSNKLHAEHELVGENVVITPGFINPISNVGLKEQFVDKLPGDDTEDKSYPINPHFDTISGINHSDKGFEKLREMGFLINGIGPGDMNLLGGNIVLVKNRPGFVEDNIINGNIGIKSVLGSRTKGVSENPAFPKTRTRAVAALRQILYTTKDYISDKNSFSLMFEALVPIVKKHRPLFIHANRADDVFTALRIKEEFNINIVIVGGAEAHKAALKLKSSNTPVLLTLNSMLTNDIEVKEMRLDNLSTLAKLGVLTGITSDYQLPASAIYDLLLKLVDNGFEVADLLQFLTLNNAKILGIDNSYGSLEEGKNATFNIFRTDELSHENILWSVIDGEVFAKKGERNYVAD